MDSKIKIIIASLLKPIDDTRAFEKIGRSLAQTNKYDVNIIGFESKKTPVETNIFFQPIYNANRNHLLRLFAPLKLFRICYQVKPKLLIVNTPELLLVSYVNKIIFGTKIIYDVMENYQMNLTSDTIYPKWQKPILHFYLRLVQGLSRYFVSHYFLAERIYAEQLTFLKKDSYTIIENKAIRARKHAPILETGKSLKSRKELSFIISGTLGKTYGTLAGIQFFKAISHHLPNANLHIIGYSADLTYKKTLIGICNSSKNIQLTIAEHPIEHKLILDAIQEADIALLPYEINDNLRHRIPTKFYEYAASQLPLIIPENKPWLKFIDKYNAGITVNFDQSVDYQLSQKIINTSYYKAANLFDIYWNTEEKKLLKVIDTLI
ncbi:MAG: hypothetical protein ACI9XJ_000517 [Marivirga sp.]